MALGGGIWTSQNKILPGTYQNFVSAKVTGIGACDRGVCAIPFTGDWGESNKVLEVTKDDFERYARTMFGYEYTHEKLTDIREVFRNAKKAYLYRMDKGGVKAENNYATAKYTGTRGNNIVIKIAANIEAPSKFDVSTLLDGIRVDKQTVANIKDLKPNDFVEFKTEETLKAEAGVPLANGANGTTVTGTEQQAFLDAIEPYAFNTLGCVSEDETTKKLYIEYTKRMRNEVGKKFQVVVHNYPEADDEAVLSVKNNIKADLVYWMTGRSAACKPSEDNTNKVYDGEKEINLDFTQFELENCITNGELVFHRVGKEARILSDINTLTTYTEDKGEVFSSNQTIRIIDALSEEVADIFNTKYMGGIGNEEDGRVSLWSDILDLLRKKENEKAIENVLPEDVIVEKGKDKNSVLLTYGIEVIGTMKKLYVQSNVK